MVKRNQRRRIDRNGSLIKCKMIGHLGIFYQYRYELVVSVCKIKYYVCKNTIRKI